VNVARASLEELLLDYEDYLRQRGRRQWAKEDPEALAVREVGGIRTRLIRRIGLIGRILWRTGGHTPAGWNTGMRR
jgi:hypothetical protein